MNDEERKIAARRYNRWRYHYNVPLDAPSVREGILCAVCKQDAGDHGAHTKREIADHFRSELVRRGYPDPWAKDEREATA